ncbi:hypothetical protein OC845_002354 [Tilletia horrida]|nr:hypothetical protein OC845_002354 [Tilletia horrida]
MKTLRKSQTLAILAAGNGLQWRRSDSDMTESTSNEDLGSRSVLSTILCYTCLSREQPDSEEDDAFLKQINRPTISKPQVTGSNSDSSIGSTKYSSSVAPSLPPLECETVHITFRRDILLASPSSWSSGADPSGASPSRFGLWQDLIPTPPERSSSRTSASRPVRRGMFTAESRQDLRHAGLGLHSYHRHRPMSASGSSLTSNFGRASILPTAIQHAFSQDLDLADTFSPVQPRVTHRCNSILALQDAMSCKDTIAPPRSSAHLQACLEMSLPSPPPPALVQEKQPWSSQSHGLQSGWPCNALSAISSTDTLVTSTIFRKDSSSASTDQKYDPFDDCHASGTEQEPALLDVALTPPPSFTACLKLDSDFSPSFTIEAISPPGSPITSDTKNPFSGFGQAPLTPATFNTFETSGTPLMDRFPRVETPVDRDDGEQQKTLSLPKTSCNLPHVVVQKHDPAFLSPNWASPRIQDDSNEAVDIQGSIDSKLSTPRCRMGMIQTSLSSSTSWLLRTAIQASSPGEDIKDLTDISLVDQTATEGMNTRSVDLRNFKEALGRLQAAVNVPLTRQSFDGNGCTSGNPPPIGPSNEAASFSDANKRPKTKTKSKTALNSLLQQLGMQPFTPPLPANEQFDAAEAVAAEWAARCRRSLCKAVYKSGLSPGSLVDSVVPDDTPILAPAEHFDMTDQSSDGENEESDDDEGEEDDENESVIAQVTSLHNSLAAPGFDSPAPSFNFSVCQDTPTLDDFPYTLAALAALRKPRHSNVSTAPRWSTIPRSSSDPTAGRRDSTATIGLGLATPALEHVPDASLPTARRPELRASSGADSIFELYGGSAIMTPKLGSRPMTFLRRANSDASLSTVRSARTSMRRSMAAASIALTPSSDIWAEEERLFGATYRASGNSFATWAQWRSEPPRCPPPACPLPPLPDLPSRYSLLVRPMSRTLL